MNNPIIENHLIQFQKILGLLIKRSSETALFPVISYYKSKLETEINFIIAKTQDNSENPEDLLLLTRSIDEFLTKKLDVEIRKVKYKNKSLYTEYEKCRTQIEKEIKALPTYVGQANFGITQILNLPYLSSRNFLIKNTGPVNLSFSLSKNFKNLEGILITLQPNESIMRSSGKLNPNGQANILYAVNSTLKAGSYKIWIL